jgi:hypothetical protein
VSAAGTACALLAIAGAAWPAGAARAEDALAAPPSTTPKPSTTPSSSSSSSPSSPASPSPTADAIAAPWAIELGDRLELTPGAVSPVRITLRGRGRHGVAPSGLRIDLTPSARGISVRQRRYQRGDAAEADTATPTFSIPVRAEAAGSYSLDVRVRFWVCTAKSCQPVDERRAIAVEVREPPPPPAPPITEPPPPAPSSPPPRAAKPSPRKMSEKPAPRRQ